MNVVAGASWTSTLGLKQPRCGDQPRTPKEVILVTNSVLQLFCNMNSYRIESSGKEKV